MAFALFEALWKRSISEMFWSWDFFFLALLFVAFVLAWLSLAHRSIGVVFCRNFLVVSMRGVGLVLSSCCKYLTYAKAESHNCPLYVLFCMHSGYH